MMGYRKRNDDEESDVLRRMLEQIPPVGSHKVGVPPAAPPDAEPHDTIETTEESVEMSPVIYRPSGPDRDPERGSGDDDRFDEVDETPDAVVPPPPPPRSDTVAFDEGLDDDPEIAEDELVDEAEDALLDDLEEPQPDLEHDFGPATGSEDITTPVPPPVPQRRRRRIFGHHDEPEQDVDADEPEVDERSTNAESHYPVRRRRVRNLHVSAPPTASEIPEVDEPGLGDDEIAAPDLDGPSAETPPAPALRGHVASTRGRGLSGMTVTVLDTTGDTVASTVTGRRGRYAIAQLEAGTYWVVASDTVDGDFNDGAHDDHAAIEVHHDHPLDGIDVQQIGRVAIAADIDASPDGSTAAITVLDRSTGMPAKGIITVTTEHFGTDLELHRGRARISVPGEDLGGRLRIEYSGSRHNAAAKRTVRVR